jgi:transcriptional regulator with XRE-family HTH domain
MLMGITRTYSRTTRAAATLLGDLIRVARKEQRMTEQEAADRAGISRSLLKRIEKGDLKCEIGATFEIATVLGIRLFELDERELGSRIRQTEEKLALLPKSVRKKTTKVVRDDF